MADKIYTDEELDYIVISGEMIDQAKPFVRNAGLSQSLIDELSADSSSDGLICLISLQLSENEWYNFTSNKTEYIGVNERGEPQYKTNYEGVDYLYIPFQLVLASAKAGGELSSTQIRIANTDSRISELLENPEQAIKVKTKLISKINHELIQATNNGYMNAIVNTISEITGQVTVSNILNEQLPSARNYFTI